MNYYRQHNIVSVNKYSPHYSAFYIPSKYRIKLDFPYQKNYHLKEFYYLNSRVVSDSGVIFSEEENKHFIEFDREESTIFPKFPGKEFLFIAKVFASNRYKTYVRNYIKVPDIIANVGGFLSLYMNILVFFYDFLCFVYPFSLWERRHNSNQALIKSCKSMGARINNHTEY